MTPDHAPARRRHPIRRALVVCAGFSVLLLGLALVVLPGPAFIVIPLGLGILATELGWAARMLVRLRLRRPPADRKPR